MSTASQIGGREMPFYRCHKDVHALKIEALIASPEGLMLVPAEEGYASFVLPPEYVQKHNPQPGGYYVVYKDGYASFSPAAAFEEGYTLIR